MRLERYIEARALRQCRNLGGCKPEEQVRKVILAAAVLGMGVRLDVSMAC